jgi:hypothetical protein
MTRESLRKPQVVRGDNFFHIPDFDAVHYLFFREEILPPGRGAFKHADVNPPIYFDDREWVEFVEFGKDTDPFRHEGYLNELFWREEGPPVLCVLGSVGTGKSTLVEYYLRCYCPKQRPDDFRKKLIVWVNARGFDPSTAREQFFNAVKSAIEEAFERKGRSFKLHQPTANVYDWVMTALKEISRSSSDPEAGFEYVVLVVDNLEQTHVNAQEKILRVIEDWRSTVQIKLWRIILPLWKSTYKSLKGNAHALLHNAKPFEIGPIRRQRHLERFTLCRRWLRDAIYIPDDLRAKCSEFLDYWYTNLGPHIAQVERLCDGDLRRQFRVLGDFLKSNYIHGCWANQQDRISDYEATFALICGRYDALDHDLTKVGNILTLGNGKEKPRDMMIGWHFLHLLGQEETKWQLDRKLSQLGYAAANIGRCGENNRNLNVYHQNLGDHDHAEVVPHKPVIDEYIALASNPAYVDAIAPVTPIDRFQRDLLNKRLATLNDSFAQKTEVALEFIKFIRDNEQEFLDITRTRRDLNCDRFEEVLRGVRLPFLWVPMATHYARRLNGLRRSGTLSGIPDSMWEHWLASEVFTAADEHPLYMTAPLPSGGHDRKVQLVTQ